MMYVKDTIAAISTPVGEGGIGIIRVSGPAAGGIAGRLFQGNTDDGGFSSHRFYYGSIIDPGTALSVDEVLVVLMKGPRSYTREDVLEIHCHGGFLIVQEVLRLVLAHGARAAEPGEFTKRAFLNGRIDLVQAEAVIDIIRSRTETALALAQHQRSGALSVRIQAVSNRLLQALSLLEAHIDFPEDEVGPAALDEIAGHLRASLAEIRSLISGFSEGKLLRDGVAVLIAGKPNVGKSSLLNALLQESRAIVTSVPGTTRDVIEEIVNVGGLPVRLLDTAGIRETNDPVESEGVRRTLENLAVADLVLFTVDMSRPFDAEDRAVLEKLAGSRVLLVKNKADLPSRFTLPVELEGVDAVEVSVLQDRGVTQVREKIRNIFLHGKAVDGREFVAISRQRHRDALAKAASRIETVSGILHTATDLSLLAWELRECLVPLEELTGKSTPDDVLDLIFSRFCVGK